MRATWRAGYVRLMPEHAVAVAVVVDGARVLLAHRHPHRTWYPNCWDLIGGHLEAGEIPFEAVRRECREELGIDVHVACPLAMLSSDPTVEVHAFVVTGWSGAVSNVATDEHDDLRWFEAHELTPLTLADQAILPVVLKVLRSSRDQIAR